MAAATSRSMLKSSSAALNLFNKWKPIVNRMLPLRALPSIESAASPLINQMEGFDEKMLTQQLPVPRSVAEGMLMARHYRKVPVIEEDEDEDDGEFGDESDIDMIDEEDEEDDEFDDEEEEFVKTKVRTRSHRDL